MENINQKIRKDASTVLLMVVLFIVYYFVLIAIGLALFGVALWVTFQIPDMFSGMHSISIRGIIVLVLAFAAMWWFCFQIGWFLIKPLFIVQKYPKDGLLEITANDCQELFATINDVAIATGNKMPKHVFLSSETNAYVSYNSTSLWSIFFPARKNLTIGIGLLRGLSKNEVKAIISHEFGHFSQKTMKVGSVTYRLLLIVRKMVEYAQERQESNAVARVSENYRWYFHLENRPISLITQSVIAFYNWINKKDKSLSRNMEFEADAVACSIAGGKAVVSSLCKLETISDRYSAYEKAIFNLLQNGYHPSDFWKGYLLFDGLISEKDGFTIVYTDVFTQSTSAEVMPPSQLQFSNEYSTHPSLEERIFNANKHKSVSTDDVEQDASFLIPVKSLNEIGTIRMMYLVKRLGEQTENETITWDKNKEMGMEQFQEWVVSYCHDNYSPRFISPFVNREVAYFDKPQIDEKEEVPSPFTNEYRKLLLYYQQGLKDWNTLVDLHSNGRKIQFIYNNQTYTDAEAALKVHKEYLDSFSQRLQALDILIYKFLQNKTCDKSRVETIYWMMMYSNDYMHELSGLRQYTNELDAQIAFYRQHGESVSIKDEIVTQVDNDFKTFLKRLDFDLIDSLIGHWENTDKISVHEQLVELKQYLDDTIKMSGIMLVNRLANNVWAFLEEMHSVSKREWSQRVVAAYMGEDFDASHDEESKTMGWQNNTGDNANEDASSANTDGEKMNDTEEMEEAEADNWASSQCMECEYYSEKVLSSESQFPTGDISVFTPGIGVQSVVGWCTKKDAPVEDETTDCPVFCKRRMPLNELGQRLFL